MGLRVSPLHAAVFAVGAALVVSAAWCGRAQAPVVESALEGTVAVRITRHDELGLASKPVPVRERTRVRAIVESLGVDAYPAAVCPADYASAEVGMLLVGHDVYGRRNVYVWNLFGDAGAPSALVVTSSGCRGGPPSDAPALRREILAAGLGASDAAR